MADLLVTEQKCDLRSHQGSLQLHLSQALPPSPESTLSSAFLKKGQVEGYL